MRIAVTGGRAFRDREFVFATLDQLHREHGITELAAGDAGKLAPISNRILGVDLQAITWAEGKDIPYACFEADWDRYGRAAGPIRNRAMLDEFKPDLLCAFPGGVGTADCMTAARERNIEVVEFAPEQEPPPFDAPPRYVELPGFKASD